jgi:phosphate transport system substrate-binding protein
MPYTHFVMLRQPLLLLATLVFFTAACSQPEYGVKLSALPSGVQIPADLQKKLRYDAASQSLLLKDHLTAAEKEELLKLSEDKSYRRAIQGLFEYNQPEETTQKGEMAIGVDPALMPLAEILVKAFNEKRPEAKIILEPMSASEALSEIANGRLRYALTIRDSSTTEGGLFRSNKIAVQRRISALDAFCFIVHPQNSTTELGLQQVKYLLTGKVKDWSEVDKSRKPTPVKIFLSNDGRAEYLRDSVLAGGKFSDSSFVCMTKAEMIDAVKRTPGALGYLTMLDVKDVIGVKQEGGKFVVDLKDTTQFKVLAIKAEGFESSPVLPLQGYVANGEYPLSYRVYYFQRTQGQLPAGFSGFLQFGTLGEGQDVLFKNGLVPFTQKIVIRQ